MIRRCVLAGSSNEILRFRGTALSAAGGDSSLCSFLRDSRPGFSRPVPRVGQPGSGVTPAKNPCGWHGGDQGTKRRDRRSEDCVLELSRSHPAGVIGASGKKKEQSEESRPCSFPARHPEPAAAGEGSLFDFSPSA